MFEESTKVLTIIIPSYNMEACLTRALRSLVMDDMELMQKLDVIIVNDGSKDRTSEIAHEFEKEHPGIFRVVDKPNGHYGSCINTGLSIAEGQYIKILDADDWLDTSSLKQVVRELSDFVSTGKNIDLVLTDFDQVNENGKILSTIRYPFPTGRVFGLDEVLVNCSILSMHGMIYRTAMLHGMQYRQTEGMLYTDGEWVTIPISMVKSIRFLPCSLYKYLIGREGQSVAQYSKNVRMVEHLLKTVCQYYYSSRNMNAETMEYFRRFIRITARKIYAIWLLRKPISDVNNGLMKFDVEFRKLSFECYDAIKFPIFTFFFKGGIDYIKRWRKNQHLTIWECIFLRIYVCIHDRIRG